MFQTAEIYLGRLLFWKAECDRSWQTFWGPWFLSSGQSGGPEFPLQLHLASALKQTAGLGEGSKVLVAGGPRGGPCEEPRAGHSWFQPVLTHPPQGTAEPVAPLCH